MFKKIVLLLPFIAAFILLPAINGPLLLDDGIHLDPIAQWLANKSDTFHLIFGNTSGPFGRPISIISFVLNALSTGTQIWPMKLTNLVLHLVTGLSLILLFHRLFRRDPNLCANAIIVSIAAASLWLILPQHISTVFYLIQRMTILAALFSVLACWLYVIARERMEADKKKGVLLLLGVAVLTSCSVLSKESGLMIPFYCLVIECIYFQPSIEKPRPGIITWAFRLGLFLPCILVGAYLTLTPSFVLHGYLDRPFSMSERVMTQISVVSDYFFSTFIPMTRSAGVYNDDFPIAQHFSTQEALLLLAGIALLAAAIRLRKSYPSFSAGIGLFFTGHLLESSIFPLEIYFAHRNYFPSMGLMLAACGLTAGIINRHPDKTASFRRILPLAFLAFFIAYGIATFSRAQLWSNNDNLMAHAQIHHPTSSRMRSEMLLAALYQKRLDLALQQADVAMQTAAINEKRTIQLWRILAYCYAQTPQPKSELEALLKMPGYRITMATSTALDYVSAAAEANACPGLDRSQLGALASRWAVNTGQYPWEIYVWKTHFAAARLSASSGDLKTGYKQALWAFNDSGYSFDAGLLAYQLANSLEDAKAAQEIMSRLVDNHERYTDKQKTQIRMLRKQ